MQTIDSRKKLVNSYIQFFPEEVASIFNAIPTEELLSYLEHLPPQLAGEVMQSINAQVVSSVLERADDTLFLGLTDSLDAYTCSIMMSRLNKALITQKLSLLPDKKSKAIQELLHYPPSSAGALMDTRILSFHPDNTVEDVLIKLRTLKDRRISVIYLSSNDGKLLGKVPVQSIAISSPDTLLSDLSEPSSSILVMSPHEDVVTLFEQGKIVNLPVVDMDNKLLGVIRNDAVIAATHQDATEDVMAMFGAGREERALSSPWLAVKKRLPWLQINLVTAFLAASIVGIFEDTIAQITVLAVFLPVVAGQSGNTGSQALAVTMRGLALREIQTSHWWQVARKEVLVGFLNGVAVALSTSVVVYFWASSWGLSFVLGVSMVLSMVIAGFSGAVVPIVLKAVGQDPAQSSSIVLTTITDIMGFLSFLGLATLLGSALGIL